MRLRSWVCEMLNHLTDDLLVSEVRIVFIQACPEIPASLSKVPCSTIACEGIHAVANLWRTTFWLGCIQIATQWVRRTIEKLHIEIGADLAQLLLSAPPPPTWRVQHLGELQLRK
jgi:hypothetical protein